MRKIDKAINTVYGKSTAFDRAVRTMDGPMDFESQIQSFARACGNEYSQANVMPSDKKRLAFQNVADNISTQWGKLDDQLEAMKAAYDRQIEDARRKLKAERDKWVKACEGQAKKF